MTALKKYRAYLPLIALGLAALGLAERLFLLVDRYAVNIFFADQWEFNDATVFQPHSFWQIFLWQQGPHREGLGGVLSKLVEPFFRWDSRMESFLVAGLLVASTALALWLKRRLTGALDYYDVVIPSIFLTATQCELIFGDANLALGALPLLLVVVYCLCWTIPARLPRIVAVLILNFALIFTGFGVLMGMVTPIALLAALWMSPTDRQHLGSYLPAMSLAAVSLALFFVGYRWNPDVPCYDSGPRSPAEYFRFAALMHANYLGFDSVTSKHPEFWGVLLLGLLLATIGTIAANIVLAAKSEPGHPSWLIVPFVLMAFSLAFAAATAHGRVCLGLGAAQESRYMPYLTPGFLGAYLYLSRVLPKHWLRHSVLAVFLGMCAYAGWPVHAGDQMEMTGFRETKLRWKSCYLANKNIDLCNRQVGRRICNPRQDPHLQQKLDLLETEHLNLFSGQ
jgi:hypothetical protein